ncbi:MAG TPA: GvpL/GvpF family gas vesicle protein [Thermoleophilaceae bacterium]|nr:GvpL/GvpF family gas vesicle protein [Thermoleophilaceae bacterium]
MSDELARWAAERAPALLARAEEEALIVLRDALVAAALGERKREATPPSPPPSGPAPEPEAGELVWAYCVMSEGEPRPAERRGIDPGSAVQAVEAGGLVALVSRVPRAEFGEAPLRQNLNDLDWLERVARAHEAVLDAALEQSTIVPLRLCTLYESEEGVRQMLEHEAAALREAIDLLRGRQEWSVKVIVDPDRLSAEAHARSEQAQAFEHELEGVGGGGAYMLRRRLERHLREASESLARELAHDVHGRLEERALDAVTRAPQNRELSGHEGEMILNAAYLVDAERVNELRDLVAQLEAQHETLGARIELSGPWPPYNFVPSGAATIA